MRVVPSVETVGGTPHRRGVYGPGSMPPISYPGSIPSNLYLLLANESNVINRNETRTTAKAAPLLRVGMNRFDE